jgi:iron complex outermembrane receptor protein
MNKFSQRYFLMAGIACAMASRPVLAAHGPGSGPGGLPGSGAKGSLSGKITEKANGSALSGATVYIPDLKSGTVTDSGGHYTLNDLPTGTYLVEVGYVGFKTVTRNVHIDKTTVENFELSQNIVEENEVVITGLSKATQIRRSPVPIISIKHEYIAINLSNNIIDAIARVPGVTAVTTGPNVSKPFIRGLGFNRILTLFDGIRQEGQQWGDEHGIEVDQYSIDRVEVIKGPASLSYGSDALAGVVNLIPYQPAGEGKMIGDVLAEYHTNNGLIGASAMLGATKNGVEWMGRVSHKEATNYQNKYDGRVYNTGFKETDASVNLGLHRKWGYSHLDFVLYDDLQEIPDGSRDSASRSFTKQISDADQFRPIVPDAELNSYAIPPLHQHVQHYRVYSSNNFILGEGRLALNLGYQRSIRREFSHPDFAVPGLYLILNSLTYDLKYSFPEWHLWNLTLGLNGQYADYDVTKGTEFVIPSYKQFDIGPFFLLKKTFDKLDIAGGFRYDSRSFSNSDLYTKINPLDSLDMPVTGPDTSGADKPFSKYSKVFSGFSGSFGLTYNFSERFSVKANVSRGYRAPNIAEISANGVHPGTNIYQVGNPDFQPEFSFQEDLGFVFTSKYAVLNLSVFDNSIQHYIYNQKIISSAGQDSILQGNQVFQFQAGKAQLYGGEASVDIHPVKSLHIENSVSIVYGNNQGVTGKQFGDSARYLPQIPPLHGISEIRYDWSLPSAHLINAFGKLQLEYAATQNRVYLLDNTESRTPGYALFNAGLGGSFTNKMGKTVCMLYLMANNLFDLAYQDHLSRLKYFEPYPTDPRPHHGIYNMGRNISLKLDFPLNFSLGVQHPEAAGKSEQ